MRRRIPLFVLSGLILALTLACTINFGEGDAFDGNAFGRTVRGTGPVVEDVREIDDINAVELATTGTLIIELGDEPELIVEAQEELLPYLRTEVRGDTLVIDTEPGSSLRSTRAIRYFLTVESLEHIELSSSGDAEAPDLEADEFEIRISSSGDLEMGALTCDDACHIRVSSSGDVTLDAVNAPQLDVDISSSGNVRIRDGEVERQEIQISSSGDYDARDVESADATVRISSSGNATVRVADQLDAELSSSGDLTYYGDPSVDENTTSSGDIRRGGD